MGDVKTNMSPEGFVAISWAKTEEERDLGRLEGSWADRKGERDKLSPDVSGYLHPSRLLEQNTTARELINNSHLVLESKNSSIKAPVWSRSYEGPLSAV